MENIKSTQAPPLGSTQQETQTVKLELNAQEFNTVVAALSELPHRVADGILKNLSAQVQPQVAKFQQK